MLPTGHRIAGVRHELATANEKLAARAKDSREQLRRLEALQGAKEKAEAELHAALKARRTAELGWHGERAELDEQLRVRRHLSLCKLS
jgi:septal ring factor EnvC (AmiA/AmiB activator)